jgi:ABC-type uncharacterized transport system auxiliary subunit
MNPTLLSVKRRAGWAGGLLITAVCLLAIAGCGAARPSKYYQLTLPNEAGSAPVDPIPVVLLVGPIRASHLYREDQIVYSGAGPRMGTYEYQRWASPPTEMIAEMLLRELRNSGHYRAVNELRSSSRGDFVLHGHLYDFKEVVGSPSLARMTLETELRDVKAGTVVWSLFYQHDEPVSGKEVSAVAAALDRNAQQWANHVATQLHAYFAAHPATGGAAQP